MHSATGGISAADITVPSSAAALPPIAIDGVLHRVREMLDGCGTSNRNDLLVIAIEALIEAGVDAGPRIVGAAASLGFKPAHAGALLATGEGGSPERHRWQRGSDGVYRLHPAKLAA